MSINKKVKNGIVVLGNKCLIVIGDFMGFFNRLFGNKKKDPKKAVEELLRTSNINESRRVIEQYPELLSEDADLMLLGMLKIAQFIKDEKTISKIQSYRNLLAICRETGIAQAFEKNSITPNEKYSDNLQRILNNIKSLSRLQDMPRKIELLQHASSLIHYQSNPELWAAIQLELGNSFSQTPERDRDENIERAIEHYNRAAEMYTHLDLKFKLAETQFFLAIAYENRIKGDKADNIEKSIEYYRQALKVTNYQNSPMNWASIQYNLANIYRDRIKGDKAENLEQAIEHYNQAQEVFTYQNFPMNCVWTQSNLANVYVIRIIGDKAENIELAIEHYNQALNAITYQDYPVDWATIQCNLADAFRKRIRGDKTENFEQVINHYTQALKVYTYQDFPLEWASTQRYLAFAYFSTKNEGKAENIEKAIVHYNQALKVYTYQNFPMDWARTQSELAAVYISRMRGDMVENVEQAIEYCNQALKVIKSKDYQIEWGNVQHNLANAYWSRIRGDKANNLEQAIEHYKQALKVFTFQDYPLEWAMTLNDLANAYWKRLRGNEAENIELAIDYYLQTLKVFTFQNHPLEWASTQYNLANAYNDRFLGLSAENIELAIKHYNQALEVRKYHDFPVEWARSQNGLANAYRNRKRGDKSENIELAIKYYNQAMRVLTYQDFPVDWAMIQHNLANTYRDRIRGDKAENIELAIEHYNQALKIRTYHDFPVGWALTQSNLGAAYWSRIRGDKVENIEKALRHCNNTFEIYKLETMPNDFCRVCKILGGIFVEMGKWEDALESYKNAIAASDLLYRSGLSAESKSYEVGFNVNIFQEACFAANQKGLTREALVFLERGKTRILNESLQLKTTQPEGVPKEVWKKYVDAGQKYRSVTNLSSWEDYILRERTIQKARKDLDLTEKLVQNCNHEFQRELNFDDISLILDEETSLLTFCITNKGSIGFVINRSIGIRSVDIPNFKTDDLYNLLYKPNEHGLIQGGLIGDYLRCHDAFGTKSYGEAFYLWDVSLKNTLPIIGARLLYPILVELPIQTKRLIILPTRGLSLLPLHTIPLANDQLLCQRYVISYAPSISLLQKTQNRAKTFRGEGFYAIINPQEDDSLIFSMCEGNNISKFFPSPLFNVGETGTKATVLDSIPGRAYIHFSCHGNYNWNDPSQSGLYLAGGRTLSLADLQNDIVDMSSARLVTLSACETGITDILKGSADEFVGLPAGFMLAGVPCVVSSLWSVPEISTAILMERFYSSHIEKGMDIPHALQDAQLWVRDLTSRQVADYVENCYLSGKWEGKSRKFIEQYRENYLKMAEKFPEEKPFQHPYYWAAFTVNGA
jgi:CHAT domain-containing protein